MPNSSHDDRIARTSGLVGTITGMFLSFHTIATSPLMPKFSDLASPILTGLLCTILCMCVLHLLHALINHQKP